jgi:hypothetical protein
MNETIGGWLAVGDVAEIFEWGLMVGRETGTVYRMTATVDPTNKQPNIPGFPLVAG